MKTTKTVLFTGFIGSGKTRRIKKIIRSGNYGKIAWLVNESGAKSGESEARTEGDLADVMPLVDTCYGCSNPEDVTSAFRDIAKRQFDLILVEQIGFVSGYEMRDLLVACGTEPLIICLVSATEWKFANIFGVAASQLEVAHCVGVTHLPFDTGMRPSKPCVSMTQNWDVLEFIRRYSDIHHSRIFNADLDDLEWFRLALKIDTSHPSGCGCGSLHHSDHRHVHDHVHAHEHAETLGPGHYYHPPVEGSSAPGFHSYNKSLLPEATLEMIEERVEMSSLRDYIFRVKGVVQGQEFSKKFETPFETTMADKGPPYVIVYCTKELPREFWDGMATDHIPKAVRLGTKEQVLNAPVDAEKTIQFIEEKLKTFPKEPLMSEGGPIIQPDIVQAILMMRKREGAPKELHDRIIRESVRYWVECAKLFSEKPTWLDNESAPMRCYELVSMLGWFATQEKTSFKEETLKSYYPYIANAGILRRALDMKKHHPDDRVALGFVRDLRSILTEICPSNLHPLLRDGVAHCVVLAEGRPELEKAYQELLENVS